MNKTLLEGRLNNKWITTTESLQKRLCAGSKNLVIEIEKLIDHLSAAKKRIKNRNCNNFFSFFVYETYEF